MKNLLVLICLLSCHLLNGFNLNGLKLNVDPEVYMNISQIIKYNGYPCEEHNPVTSDGYILSLQRIPKGRNVSNYKVKNSPSVLLQHGLLDSAHTWTNNLQNQSLAFILADAGFDVWLSNSRGNTYSNKNVKYPSDSRKFWEFSWDNMAASDLPTFVDYVLNVTKQKNLTYIGHSQGTLMAFASLPTNSKLRSQISSFVALGPVAWVGHVEAGLKFVAKFNRELELLLELFGHGQFLTNSPLIKEMAKTLCTAEGLPRLCADFIFLLAGYDIRNLNESRLPIYISHTPAGSSLMNVIHYAQGVNSNKFQKYDYGFFGNLKHYGQTKAPEYTFNGYSTPTMLVSGGKDVLANPTDVTRLVASLGSNVKHNLILADYNHMDFVWAIDAPKRIYPQIISFIKQYIKQ